MITIDWSLFVTLVLGILGADAVKLFVNWLSTKDEE